MPPHNTIAPAALAIPTMLMILVPIQILLDIFAVITKIGGNACLACLSTKFYLVLRILLTELVMPAPMLAALVLTLERTIIVPMEATFAIAPALLAQRKFPAIAVNAAQNMELFGTIQVVAFLAVDATIAMLIIKLMILLIPALGQVEPAPTMAYAIRPVILVAAAQPQLHPQRPVAVTLVPDIAISAMRVAMSGVLLLHAPALAVRETPKY